MRVRAIPVLLTLMLFLLACEREDSARPAATPTPGPTAFETAQQFLAFWKAKQYAEMYPLISSQSQQSITQERFTVRYAAIADEATIRDLQRYRGIRAQLTAPRKRTEAQARQLIPTA